MHQLQPDARGRAGGDLGQHVGDLPAVDPAGPRRRRSEADEVEQVERGAAAVEHADDVRQGVPAVVAGRGGEHGAPLVELGVEFRQVRRERQRPQIPVPGQRRQEFVLPVAVADEGAAYLVEAPPGVMAQDVPAASRERPQAGAQPVRALGLIAGYPLAHRAGTDPDGDGHRGGGLALVEHPPDDGGSTLRRQLGILMVVHSSLLPGNGWLSTISFLGRARVDNLLKDHS